MLLHYHTSTLGTTPGTLGTPPTALGDHSLVPYCLQAAPGAKVSGGKEHHGLFHHKSPRKEKENSIAKTISNTAREVFGHDCSLQVRVPPGQSTRSFG